MSPTVPLEVQTRSAQDNGIRNYEEGVRSLPGNRSEFKNLEPLRAGRGERSWFCCGD